MQHKGAIVEKAVRESGFPISRIAKKLGKTARWMYFLFNNPNAPLHHILAIGEVIHYDFSESINELKKFIYQPNTSRQTEKKKNEAYVEENFWKDKYLDLLEQYTQLLEEHQAEFKKRK
jgi:CRISPR/Cas system-associated exonuclease Cas4 (RecB family)